MSRFQVSYRHVLDCGDDQGSVWRGSSRDQAERKVFAAHPAVGGKRHLQKINSSSLKNVAKTLKWYICKTANDHTEIFTTVSVRNNNFSLIPAKIKSIYKKLFFLFHLEIKI
jgi:hypothetical protein